MESQNPPNPKTIKKLKQAVYAFLIAILLASVCMFWLMREKSETYRQNISMKDELAQLMSEYEEIKQENLQFQTQLTERDSVILANSAEIEKLINSQADYRKVKRKLDLLRDVTQDYVRRIDSLLVLNEELTVENFEIKKEISAEREKNRELTKVKTELDEKVTQASTLKAYNIKAFGVRVKGSSETETDKAVRSDKLIVEFTLSENKIIPAGTRAIYVRIARPDGEIMAAGDGDAFSFEVAGTVLQYSIKKDIVYDNTSQHIRMWWLNWNAKYPIVAGRYNVSVFTDNQEIGRTSFELK
ncbi:MAG: hypothetical protein LBU91_02410 [Bacteroidales bacterium]|jgi:hypothetical protein|nr:hypothetical protein [Bacteroidales bacterium]